MRCKWLLCWFYRGFIVLGFSVDFMRGFIGVLGFSVDSVCGFIGVLKIS